MAINKKDRAQKATKGTVSTQVTLQIVSKRNIKRKIRAYTNNKNIQSINI